MYFRYCYLIWVLWLPIYTVIKAASNPWMFKCNAMTKVKRMRLWMMAMLAGTMLAGQAAASMVTFKDNQMTVHRGHVDTSTGQDTDNNETLQFDNRDENGNFTNNERQDEPQEMDFDTEETEDASTPYTTQRGDTVFRIAFRQNTSMQAIIDANNLTPPYTLYVGQELKIPNPGSGFVALGTNTAPAAKVAKPAFLSKAAADKALSGSSKLATLLDHIRGFNPQVTQALLKNMAEKGLPGLGKGNNVLLALVQLMAIKYPADAANLRDNAIAVLGEGDFKKALEKAYGSLKPGKNAVAMNLGKDKLPQFPLLVPYAGEEIEPAGGNTDNGGDFGFNDDADGEDVLENPNNLSPNTAL